MADIVGRALQVEAVGFLVEIVFFDVEAERIEHSERDASDDISAWSFAALRMTRERLVPL